MVGFLRLPVKFDSRVYTGPVKICNIFRPKINQEILRISDVGKTTRKALFRGFDG